MIAGVDIGGTFTDLVLSHDGKLTIHKLLSSPHDPSQSMLAGLRAITDGQLALLEHVAHGSTVATNAILERKGARMAFLATGGFRDLLFIGRQNRPDLYALHPTIPPPLVERAECYDVPERLDVHGDVLIPLDMNAVDAIIDDIHAKGIEVVAVCFLYSFIDDSHERAIAERIRERGFDWDVVLSSQVLPEFREYERASSTTLEAYVRPVMARYVSRLIDALPAPLRIMKSDGGVMSAERVKTEAIQTALSGPAAGVIGAFHIAHLAGYDNIITLDMGGTSTDVSLIPGQPLRRQQSEIDGLPLRIRLLDIETVGAGGGSIAWLDVAGALHVGPQSAGADPGPIAYGQGGTEVTVSDANAVLGRLNAERFLGGGMKLDIESARQAIEQLAETLKMDTMTLADGIIRIANANIDRAVRQVSVARGYDPRAFTLVAFGGAGALHACAIADGLSMPRVLIPRYPGVLCAFGLLVANVTIDRSLALISTPLSHATNETVTALKTHLERIQDDLHAELEREGITPERREFIARLDVRYVGQAYELTMPYRVDFSADELIEHFHQLHAETYGHDLRDRNIELVNLRVQAVGLVDKPILTPDEINERQLSGGQSGTEFEREDLQAGDVITGEALVYQLDSTIYIPTGWSARVDGYHNLIIERV